MPWAILTNGKDWRLYCAAAHSRASNYYEVELPEGLGRDDLIALRYFWLFFRAASFAPSVPMSDASAAEERICFLDQLRRDSQAFAKKLGDRLRGRIFDEVFPYPSYPLPGIDSDGWEAAAWEDLCDLLRKNKTKTGNPRIRADLTGSGRIEHPTGALRQLRDTFLDHHRQIRANRARAAELDLLIDRIVFRLFDLTLAEQRLILSRVGPGRPLPPRRRRKRTQAKKRPDRNLRLFEDG